MAEKRSAKKGAPESSGFSEEERAAMKEAVRERRAQARGEKADGEGDIRAKIAEMDPTDRAMAERIHAIVRKTVPTLVPRTWYGMPAYSKDGEVLCFFQPAGKFKTRYATFGFSDEAHLDEGRMWPSGFALTGVGDAEEARIVALLKRAVG
jgi:uncharacterized protein YdhG (YjbR/CyaY superfamily)